MVGNEINCLKNVGTMQLNKATSYCQSVNASQTLPRSRQESDDLISALLSLNLASPDGKTVVSIGVYKSKEGEWYDSKDQLISYFNWISGEPDDISGYLNYAGFRINGPNGIAGWSDYSGFNETNVVCTKTAGHGKS